MSTTIRLIFISLCGITNLWGQVLDTWNPKFSEHLENNRLYNDKLVYLQTLDTLGQDSTHIKLERAWTYFKLGRHDSAYPAFHNLGRKVLLQTGYYPLWLRSASSMHAEVYFQELLKDTLGMGPYRPLVGMFALESPKEMDLSAFESHICSKYKQYHKITRKNAVSAILLATLVPGLGKYYIGKRNDGISAFITVGVLGLQFAEACWKKGIYDWRSIAFGGLALSFHTANIYGTYKALLKSRIDQKKEFLKALDENYYSHSQRYSFVR